MTQDSAWQVLKGREVVTTLRGEGAEDLARACGEGVDGYSVRCVTDETEGSEDGTETMSASDMEPDRGHMVYVTQDGTGRWMTAGYPFGLIPPPTIELHKPLGGPVVFYAATMYGLPVPAEAQQAS